MLKISEVFPPVDISCLDEEQLKLAYRLLWAEVTGDPVSNPQREWCLQYLPSLKNLLLDQYINHVRSEFEANFMHLENVEELSIYFKQNISRICDPLHLLGFKDQEIVNVKAAYNAMIRTTLDVSAFITRLSKYILETSITLDRCIDTLRRFADVGLSTEIDRAIVLILPTEIKRHIEARYKKVLDRSVYAELFNWIHTEVAIKLASITFVDDECCTQIQSMSFKELAHLRIGQLFDLVKLYPGSEGALCDLRDTINTPELRGLAIQQFQHDCTLRLLNAGVDTVDIFVTYLACVKVFSFLDPRGVLLERVSRPIHRYLKERSDTVSILVDGILGEPGSPLAFLSEKLELQNALLDLTEGDESNWVPDPLDAPADFIKKQTNDIVAALLSLYDNKEVFIKQLNIVFSSKLLQSSVESIGSLQTKAEQLKARFGRRQLQNIYVMIKDILDSNNAIEKIHCENNKLANIGAFVLSRLFWPPLKSSSLRLPSHIQGSVEAYTAIWSAICPGRSITWIPGVGRVSLTIELEDRQIDIVVTPDQAVVIHAFDETNSKNLTLGQLAAATELDDAQILPAIQFWISKGILGVDGETYKVLETEAELQDALRLQTTVAEIPEVCCDNNYEDMEIYLSYITGMLTNLGPLAVDRIHSFLLMLVPKETPYVRTKLELENFLIRLVDDEKLKYVEGKFSLL